jgi:integrase
MARKGGNGNSGKLQGTIFKKCDRAAHRPQSNRQCAAGTCQHTCEPSAVERCPHAWTLRYSASGKQVEESYRDDMDARKRVQYGTGLKKAQDAQLELTRGKRAEGQTFIAPKGGSANFGDAAERCISHMAVSERSREAYLSNYRNHVRPVFGHKTIAQVAIAHDEAADLLTVTMRDRSADARRKTRMIITGTLDVAVKTGKIARHLITDIDLYDNGTSRNGSDFVFPAFAQVSKVADGTRDRNGRELTGAGICVWLMRGCGLRIEEALAVEKSGFRVTPDGRVILRVSGQASRDGRTRLPLKKRKEGEFRDVPVPGWLWDMIKDMPGGPLMPGNGRRYEVYSTVYRRFMNAARAAGITRGFTPHSLRHAFASALLGRNVSIGDVSEWLGHKDVNTTYATYRHMLPDAPMAAAAVLETEYAEWSGKAAA